MTTLVLYPTCMEKKSEQNRSLCFSIGTIKTAFNRSDVLIDFFSLVLVIV